MEPVASRIGRLLVPHGPVDHRRSSYLSRQPPGAGYEAEREPTRLLLPNYASRTLAVSLQHAAAAPWRGRDDGSRMGLRAARRAGSCVGDGRLDHARLSACGAVRCAE
jgi:hypothetical protein